jgi:hypothetical protein
MQILFASAWIILAAAVDRNSAGYKLGGAVVTVAFYAWILYRAWRSPVLRILALVGAGVMVMAFLFLGVVSWANLMPPPR